MSKLEAATHICVITLAIISAATLLERRLAPAGARGNGVLTDQQLAGKRVEVPGLNWGTARTNVVMFISTKCRFCDDSIPFYRRLAEQGWRPPSVNVSVVSAEPPAQVKDYLTSNNVALDRAYQVYLSDFLVKATPTLMIVDSNGIIRRAFTGRLSSALEQEFLKAVNKPAL